MNGKRVEVHVIEWWCHEWKNITAPHHASLLYSIMESNERTLISLNFSAAAKVKRRAAVRLRSCMTD